eukprot:CAMPEP_0184490876 /NCGR_PEP_ID=MMETSP0113_2-20130426/19131_1 /TAXON_ID=91329 /ORGANISM="Norrisiella sphaerica, Strain BC52" /LENGTH=597 /DNA_ID=CAMNT_0026874999 /DNA_START=375 /DNA_END=2165 /DNA_ORIENTATION=-
MSLSLLHSSLLHKDDPKEILKILVELEKEKMTVDRLVKEGIGKTVNKIKKHKDPKVASKAAALVGKWKTLFRDSQNKNKRRREGEGEKKDSGSGKSLTAKKKKAEKATGVHISAGDIKDDDINGPEKLVPWASEKSNKYSVEEIVNADRVRLVEESTFERERPAQLDIGAKAKVKPLKLTHPSKEIEVKKSGPIIYWMSRDQRANDNWALLFAQQQALANDRGLVVVFNLVPTFLEATKRQYGFMLRGLRKTQENLKEKNIPLFLLFGDPQETIPKFVREHECSMLVTDFSPVRIAYIWKSQVFSKLDTEVPFYEVDAHNVVPVWKASDKLEYGARTIRRRIHNKLDTYLTSFPDVKAQETSKLPTGLGCEAVPAISFSQLVSENRIKVDGTVDEVDWCVPGERAAQKTLQDFLNKRVGMFDTSRNDPTKPQALSGVSPYLHFGQLAPQRAILEAFDAKKQTKNASTIKGLDGFIEEALVRRELSENYCFYNPNYDSLDGCWNWAKTTLKIHWNDKREKEYSTEELNKAKTHDQLWNAAQQELVYKGKMHGFMRMYWAKKILEWSPDPKKALENAIYLNDRYSIDGRDPNGYVGCMW